jgi:M6 family metalloprotease-like protein
VVDAVKKWTIPTLAAFLLMTLVAPVQAATPKAGAKCTKAGATANAGGKKFTCIKSGTKLLWNKGVAIKAAAPKPSPTPDAKIEVKNLLASDSRIAPASTLTSIATCKTEDKTPDYREGGALRHRNGFPRPPEAITGKKIGKILVIPMDFKDVPFLTEKTSRGQFGQMFSSDLELLDETIPRVKEGFKTASSGRFELIVDVLPRKDWWKFDIDNPLSSVWGTDNISKILDLIKKYKSDFVFDGYDSFVFLTGNGITGSQGLGTAQGDLAIKVENSKTGTFNAMYLAGSLQQATLWIHELGHSFFGLEDLYLFSEVFSGSSASRSELAVPMGWDLMASSNRGGLLEWNKLLMGWIEDSEVRCLTDQKSSVHYLSDSDNTNDPKLLTVNLSPGVTLAAEVRNASGADKGLLLYIVNTHQNAGEGPILSQKAVITKGQSKSMFGWQFSVIDSNADGVLFEAVKTDIDKFVPPPPKPQQNNPGQPISPIRVTKGDIVPDGFLKAKATWNVTGHESYRLYVTDAVDFQKVYFETGYVNDSRNPLVIEIKGLVCNKEFRTNTEFFTKKNGEGERIVIPSFQLRNLPCEDTTKKP